MNIKRHSCQQCLGFDNNLNILINKLHVCVLVGDWVLLRVQRVKFSDTGNAIATMVPEAGKHQAADACVGLGDNRIGSITESVRRGATGAPTPSAVRCGSLGPVPVKGARLGRNVQPSPAGGALAKWFSL